jgi:solute:Na+ symporter, SSS family
VWGTWTAWSNGLKPLATVSLGDVSYSFYVGLGALILNILVAAIVTAVMMGISPAASRSAAAGS